MSFDPERRHELSSFRDLCGEIDRLLTEGRLREAQQLNEQARLQFRRLQFSVGVTAERVGDPDRQLVGSCPGLLATQAL